MSHAVGRMPTVAFYFSRYLPALVGGRATGWTPDAVRISRNRALVVVCIQIIVAACSLPLGAARGNLGKASNGIYGALIIIGSLGCLGLLRLQLSWMLLHSMLSTALPLVFGLFLILTLTVSQGTRDDADAVVALIFISLVFDLVAGIVMTVAFLRLYFYTKQCAREDAGDAVGGGVGTVGGVGGGGGRRATCNVGGEVTNPAVLQPIPPLPIALPGGNESEAAKASRALGLREEIVNGGIVLPPNQIASLSANAANSSVNSSNKSSGGGGSISSSSGSSTAAATTEGRQLDMGLCAVCLDAQRDTAFFPCGHLTCGSCAAHIRRQYGTCPICRRKIKDSVHVYV